MGADTRARPGFRALEGKVVLITGAGSGIGRATALEAARRGARLCLVGRRAQFLAATAKLVEQAGAECACLAVDVAEVNGPEQLVSATLARFDSLDALVNNAAIARFGSLEVARDEDARRMFEVNLLAPLRLARAALPALRRARGSIVNVSSIGGVLPTPRRVAYGALKAALNHATRSLARELAPEVRVNAVLPGPVDTPMHLEMGLNELESAALLKELVTSTPAARLGQPEDIAPWICHLLDAGAAWLTGSLLTVDGGRSS